jgi:hypothetical protein
VHDCGECFAPLASVTIEGFLVPFFPFSRRFLYLRWRYSDFKSVYRISFSASAIVSISPLLQNDEAEWLHVGIVLHGIRFQRGLKRKPMALIKKLRKAVSATVYQ